MIELRHLRTERTADYELPGSPQRVQIASSGIEHYFNHDKRGDGEVRWRRCDLQWDPALTSLFGPYTVQAPATSDGPVAFANLRSDGLRTHNQARFTSRAPDALPVPAVVEGVRVVYADAFGPGNDMILELRASGLARLVRVRVGYAPRAAGYRFDFTPDTPAMMVRLTDKPYTVDTRGPKALDKATPTALFTQGGATFLRPFTAWDDEHRGTVPVVVEARADGSFSITKTAPTWWDGSTDLWMDDTSTVTPSTTDGTVYKLVNGANSLANWNSARGAATGDGVDPSGATALNVCAYYRTGATAGMRFQRSFVDVTPALVAGDTISSVTASLYEGTSLAIADDIVLTPGSQTLPPAAADFDSFTLTDYGRRAFSASEAAGFKVWTLSAAALAAFQKAGLNKYALIMGDDFDNTYPCGSQVAAGAWQFNGAENASNKPYFTITYTPAATGVVPSALGSFATIKQLSEFAS